MIDVNDFSQIRIGLATADSIRTWSNGEVKKPETINYRTLKPEKDGLFCEKIFGPMKDWECACGKYRRVRFKGIICERCGVEVTRSKVRRERMGHIELAAPAVHIWYLRGTRSWLAYLLSGLDVREELKAKSLERVIYFAANLVTWVDEEKRQQNLPELEVEMAEEIEVIEEGLKARLDERLKELEGELKAIEAVGANEIIQELRSRLATDDLGIEGNEHSRVDACVTRLGAKLGKLRYKLDGKPNIVEILKAANGDPNDAESASTGKSAGAAGRSAGATGAAGGATGAVIAAIDQLVTEAEAELVADRLQRLEKDLGRLKFKPVGIAQVSKTLLVAYKKGGIVEAVNALDKAVAKIESGVAKSAEERNASAYLRKLAAARVDLFQVAVQVHASADIAPVLSDSQVVARLAALGFELARLKYKPAGKPPIGKNLLEAYAKGGFHQATKTLQTYIDAAAKAADGQSARNFHAKLVACRDELYEVAGEGGTQWPRLNNAKNFLAELAACRIDLGKIAAAKGKSRARNPKERELNALRKAAEVELVEIHEEANEEKELLANTFDVFRNLHRRAIIDDEYVWLEMSDRYSEYFEGGMGAEVIAQLMSRLDFEQEEREILYALDTRGRIASVQTDKRDKNRDKLEKNLEKLKAASRTRLVSEGAERIRAQVDRRLKKLDTELNKLKFTPEGDRPVGGNLLVVAAKGDTAKINTAIESETTVIEAELAKASAGKTLARNARPYIRRLHACRADIDEIVAEVEAEVDLDAEKEAKLHDKALALLVDLSDGDEVVDADLGGILNEHYRDYITVTDPRRPLSVQRNQKAVKRLKILSAFNRRDEHGRLVNDPRAMILDSIPVIPPELRPMVQLDGGRFATSDLNDLYRRVINRNNRLKRLLDLGAPEIIINNEKRMLQEAVDALFDNGRRGRAVTGPGNRALKSLSDMLKGKQGRFRQNLLGKRVDYSARSVIVAGPTLRLHQCGIPKLMALELFKPFVMKRLVDEEYAQNIKSAKRMVERRRPEVWNVLEDAIKEHPVLLNRAPTLHRLGIQAFEPVLVEGKAIQIHPLVCAAFNADFDGDQMAVHLPLSPEAQAEARMLMLSANNIISPADGRPVTVPSQDMIIGAFYLTEARPNPPQRVAVAVFRHLHQIEQALELGEVTLHEPIEWRTASLTKDVRADALLDDLPPAGDAVLGEAAVLGDLPSAGDAALNGERRYELTTPGRVLFNATLPEDFPFVNKHVGKGDTGRIVRVLSEEYPASTVAISLDAIKDVCYAYASRSGLTISVEDVITPPDKADILERHEREAERVEEQFRRGIITDGELRQKEVEIWTEATEEVRASLEHELKTADHNPIEMMVESGARGNMMQVRQIAAIRGLVANPRGDIIPRPIKSSYREGLATLEYFISTPGARKGLVDTALRTADSGYLTRRLVDVAQELIVNEEDPMAAGTTPNGLWLEDIGPDRPDHRTHLETRLFSRCLATDVKLSDGRVFAAGTLIGDTEMDALRDDPDITRVQVLSPLTDDSKFGVSAKSYGGSLATGKLIEVGEAVGVIAAQSIGEPGTQLTMRTFHMGGVAGTDIAGGLPRVVELFEARTPRGKAILAERAGVVRIGIDDGRGRIVEVVTNDGEVDEYQLTDMNNPLAVADGDDVRAGDPLLDGPRDPKELVEILGVRETQLYLVEEVQKVYREQGVSIHDKHIELIIRQMTRRVLVAEAGDTDFLPGDYVDQRVYRAKNREISAAGGAPAPARPVIMGITKASLATDSWLSAASFQETTRVLTEAAIESRQDGLRGLKENIIIGKLIPAGTGQGGYRHIEVVAPDYVPMDFYSSEDTDADEGWQPATAAEAAAVATAAAAVATEAATVAVAAAVAD